MTPKRPAPSTIHSPANPTGDPVGDVALEHLKVLLLERDLVDSVGFQRAARARFPPYHITPVETLAAAREVLGKERFDVAVVDHQLADGSGLELLASFPELPTIVLTGSGDEDLARTSLRRGAFDYIVKDTEGRHLEAMPGTIQGAVAARRAERAQARWVSELERSNRELKNFSKLMTRVLTVPLESARSLAGGLRTQESVQSDPVALRVVGAIDDGLRRANAFLADLGKYTQLAEDSELPEEVNLPCMVDGLLTEFMPQLTELKVPVETRGLDLIVARPRQLRTALRAMIHNALVHGAAPGVESPELRIEQINGPDGTRIVVSDRGPGVPEADRARVFEIFRKADTSGPGSGIGLALVRRVAEIHDGSAVCQARQGGGAEFSLRLG